MERKYHSCLISSEITGSTPVPAIFQLADMNKVLKIGELVEIDYQMALPFIEKWHYSGCVPKGSHIFLGWIIEQELYAVADFGNGVNPYQASYLKRVTNLPVDNTNLVELKRLCRIEPRRENAPLTMFLAGSYKVLKEKILNILFLFLILLTAIMVGFIKQLVLRIWGKQMPRIM